MEGLTRTEPPLSRACCVGPVLYPPIAQFLFYGGIQSRMYNVRIQPRTAGYVSCFLFISMYMPSFLFSLYVFLMRFDMFRHFILSLTHHHTSIFWREVIRQVITNSVTYLLISCKRAHQEPQTLLRSFYLLPRPKLTNACHQYSLPTKHIRERLDQPLFV